MPGCGRALPPRLKAPPALGVAGPEPRPLPQVGPEGCAWLRQNAGAGLAVDRQAVERPAQRHGATRHAGQLPHSMGEGLAAVQALALPFGDRPPHAVDDPGRLARDGRGFDLLYARAVLVRQPG